MDNDPCINCGGVVTEIQPSRPEGRASRADHHAALRYLGLNGYDLCHDCWDDITDQLIGEGTIPETHAVA